MLAIWLSGWAISFCILCPLQFSFNSSWKLWLTAKSELMGCSIPPCHPRSMGSWHSVGPWFGVDVEMWGGGGCRQHVGCQERLWEQGWSRLARRRVRGHPITAHCCLNEGYKKATSWWCQATRVLGSSHRLQFGRFGLDVWKYFYSRQLV